MEQINATEVSYLSMDILRKELEEIYAAQLLSEESLDAAVLEERKGDVGRIASVANNCCVITDAACDRCFVYGAGTAALMGWTKNGSLVAEIDSSDEDFIYNCLHPEDLPDKRLLEYEFFKLADKLPGTGKTHLKAECRIRIRNKKGEYVWIDNTTQVLELSPKGKIWLILCTYDLSGDQSPQQGISPRIKNYLTGQVTELSLSERKERILTAREKEILLLIRQGASSKIIADRLSISVNTVNRHRQNILEKLSVANSFEAIKAVESMGLL